MWSHRWSLVLHFTFLDFRLNSLEALLKWGFCLQTEDFFVLLLAFLPRKGMQIFFILHPFPLLERRFHNLLWSLSLQFGTLVIILVSLKSFSFHKSLLLRHFSWLARTMYKIWSFSPVAIFTSQSMVLCRFRLRCSYII